MREGYWLVKKGVIHEKEIPAVNSPDGWLYLAFNHRLGPQYALYSFTTSSLHLKLLLAMAMGHGWILRITTPELINEGPPDYPYTGNIIFTQENPPHKTIHLVPRYDVVSKNERTWTESVGPIKTKDNIIVEEFKIPIMVKSDMDADFELSLENRTGRSEMINFAYSKSNTYTELIEHEDSTGDEWLLVPVKVTDRLRIRGIGD